MADIVIPGSQVGLGSAPAGPRPVASKQQFRAGDSLLKAAESILNFRIEQQEEADSTWETEAAAQAEVTFAEILESQKENMGRGGAGYTQAVAQALEEAIPGILETGNSVASPAAIERVQTQLKAAAIRTTGKAGVIEKGEFSAWQEETLKDDMARRSRVVLDNPALFDSALEDQISKINASGLTPAQKDQMREEATKEFFEQAYEAHIQAGDKAAAEDLINNHRLASELSGDDVTALRDRGRKIEKQQRIERERAEAEVEERQSKQRARVASDLRIAVSRGNAGVADIERAYQSDLISPSERATLTIAADKVASARQEQHNRFNLGQDAFEGQVFLDPKNKGHKAAVDEHFDRFAETLEGEDQGDRAEQMADYVSRMGVMPSQVKGAIRAGLRQTDPGAVLVASDMVQRIKSENPQALNDLTDQDIALAEAVNWNAELGMSPQEAVEKAREQSSLPDEEKRNRRDQFAVAIEDEPSRDWLESSASKLNQGGFFESDAKIPEKMVSDFEALTRQFYGQTGDLETARRSAVTRLEQNWARTRINGGHSFMKGSPEQFYGVQGFSTGRNAEWIREQALDEVAEGGVTAPNLEDRLWFTVRPDVTGPDGRPAYQLWAKQDNGTLSPLGVGAFIPDWESSKEAKRVEENAEREKVQAVEGARAKRDRKFEVKKNPSKAFPELRGLN